MQYLINALRARREQGKDAGFSLIELIVVVAILGILVAIAIPVYGNIQKSANENALKTVAANAATQVSAKLAAGETWANASVVTNLQKDGITLTVAGSSIETICVTGKKSGVADQTSGPACT